MLLTPNLIARSLFRRYSHAIPSLTESTQHPISPHIAAGVDEILIQKGQQDMERNQEKGQGPKLEDAEVTVNR